MKKLILAVFGVILAVLSANVSRSRADFVIKDGVNGIVIDNEKEIMPVPPKLGLDLHLKSVEEMTPVYRVIRQGDRLWDYVRQYNLGHPREIVEFNLGKPGQKCIKNENLILRGCEIAIPVYTQTQVQVQQVFNEKGFKKAVDVARAEGEEKYWPEIMILLSLCLTLTIVFIASLVVLTKTVNKAQKAENEEQELKKQLWEATDQKTGLETSLAHVRAELSILQQNLKSRETELSDLRAQNLDLKELTKNWPGNFIELETREGRKIRFEIAKLNISPDGSEILVWCPQDSCRLSKKSHENAAIGVKPNIELKLDNALSHFFKPHNLNDIAKSKLFPAGSEV